MILILRRFSLLAALAAGPLLLAGCDNDAEQAVEAVAGVDEGTETRTADVEQETFVVTEEKEITKKSTGEVVGREVSTTEVTVEEETKVEQDIDIKSSDTTTQTEGYVPEELSDQ